ncbi:HET-domain-containing protein [Hypomontagnella monticulosa]|nr:HET-domain-containing protein [Hypomontagnella monticulosa]
MPCSICNSLQGVGPLLTEEQARNLAWLSSRSFRRRDIPWEDLVQSARICYCCDILLRGVTACLRQRQPQSSRVLYVDISFLYTGWEGEGNDCDKDITCKMDDGSKFVVEFFTLEDDYYPCPDAWDDVPVSTRTSAETSSEEAFQKACKWISYCDNHEGLDENDPEFHGYCALSLASQSKLPIRVVDVGRQNGRIKLVEGNDQASKYLCLSHCWGSQQIITTTKSTFAERMNEIREGDLSKTFKEAIWMTRRFGIDYIWIDSLCIVQDDAADWERESAKMASIYHNAYLTIAATKSTSGNGGLFTKTPDFEISGKTPAGEDYYLVFREKIVHVISADNMTPGFPLMTRAWVYQERMLSRRVLHFGYYELFFECSSGMYCECGNIGFLGFMEEIPLPSPREMYSTALESQLLTRDGKISNRAWVESATYFIARMWRSMVMIYTGLRLSVASDRLPALGGIARTFAEKRRSSYIAGLFEDSILDDLLWMTFVCERPRLSKWRAPSWSWASIETHITYRDGLVYYDEEMYSDRQDERIEFASVENCASTTAGLDDFGQVKSASLRVTSQLLPVVLLGDGLDNLQRPKYRVCIDGAAPRILPDYDLRYADQYQVLPGTEVYCLRMIRLVEDKTDMSLILRAISTETGRVYERIGFLQLDPRTPQLDCLEPVERDLVAAALDKAEVVTVDIV